MTEPEWKEVVKKMPHAPSSRYMLAVPCVGKDVPSEASEFAHPDIAIGFTVLTYHFQGLRFNDVVNVLKDARKQLDREGGPVDLRRAT